MHTCINYNAFNAMYVNAIDANKIRMQSLKSQFSKTSTGLKIC